MKNKAFLLTILLVTPFLTGCNSINIDLRLKEKPSHTYDINSPIDIDDYVYCSHPYKMQTEVSHNGKTETIGANLYWPSEKGDYKFVTKADNKTVDFVVAVRAPEMTISYGNTPYISKVSTIVAFDDVLNSIKFKCNYQEYDYNVKSVKYRPLLATLEENKTNYVDVTTEAEVSQYYYKPKVTGEYVIVLNVFADEKSKDVSITNYVLSSFHEINDKVFVDEKGRDGVNKVIYGEEDIYMLPQAASYDAVSYVTLKEPLTVGKNISVLFKGRNLPQIGLFTKPNFGSTTPFGLMAAEQGYLFTMETRKDLVRETDKYFLVGNKLLNAGINYKEAVAGRDDFFGWDNLSSEFYYRLDVSMNVVNNGLSLNYKVSKIENYDTPQETRTVVATLTDKYGQGIPMPAGFDGGYVTLYASTIETITFKTIYTDFEKINETTYVKKGFVNTYTNNATISVTSTVRNWDGSGEKTVDHLNSVTSNCGILSLLGNYVKGTKITIDFYGKNVPIVCLFADKVYDTELYGGDKGVILSPGTTEPSYKTKFIINGPYRYDTGNPKDARYKGAYNIVFGANDRLVEYVGAALGYSNLYSTVNYQYIIEINEVEGRHAVAVTLINKDKDQVKFTNVDTDHPYGLVLPQDVMDVLGTSSNIMFFGNYEQTNISFAYKIEQE